ncbi:MAG: ABC transporter ATP-binding protein [Salinarimonadaceae bacterium]|nr:MAG: ABC transporter ATP-binding protein [Salinarimonadaceae bacterium]
MTSPPAVTIAGDALIGEARLFDGLRLDMPAGAWTSLLGPSGVGKTTILRLIAGLDTGARFEGSVTTSDGASLSGRVAYMGQSDLLAPWLDVAGNVALGARLRGERPDRARIRDLLARVGLDGLGGRRPHELSGGQRQRVALARTLMEDRAVVLLDEPFSALDSGARAQMQELAGTLLEGRTVLLVTHDPGEAVRLSARAFLMEAQGLSPIDLPPSPPVRALDAPDTIAAQAALLRRLREAA